MLKREKIFFRIVISLWIIVVLILIMEYRPNLQTKIYKPKFKIGDTYEKVYNNLDFETADIYITWDSVKTTTLTTDKETYIFINDTLVDTYNFLNDRYKEQLKKVKLMKQDGSQ